MGLVETLWYLFPLLLFPISQTRCPSTLEHDIRSSPSSRTLFVEEYTRFPDEIAERTFDIGLATADIPGRVCMIKTSLDTRYLLFPAYCLVTKTEQCQLQAKAQLSFFVIKPQVSQDPPPLTWNSEP
ncbi:hypothetical protein K443DRAFT_678967 [Laccaria amethystina LaAM-08-1]|uniref:Uncharacterized protein n=1 Tax=Laccaria amethystina LaAM-08-1 TaxID=1095629 RepID=A0A0C9X6T3_9AGAR|nr:hypothetical protein K443DRAFT_678967 [Laccaria amethystina LaAM-08-1]